MGVNTLKFSQFLTANLNTSTNQMVGINSLSGGNNIITPFTNSWTTSTRPTSPYNGLSGYNSSLNGWEFWNGTAWSQFGTSSGNVNPGTINDLAFYALTGSVISPLATAINSVLVTNNSGVPLFSTTLPPTLTGYLQAPSGFKDPNGNIYLAFNSEANAVNYAQLSNSSTGNPIGFTALGSDTNISWNFYAKGLGAFNFQASATAPTTLNFFEQTTNGTNAISVNSPASIGSNQSVTWKSASSGYPVLDSTNSDSWTSFAGSIGYTGFSGTPTTTYAFSKLFGKTAFINIAMSGTSNTTGFTITNLPYTAARTGSFIGFQFAEDNSSNVICSGSISGTTLTLYYGTTSQVAGWTNSGTKAANLQFFYETA